VVHFTPPSPSLIIFGSASLPPETLDDRLYPTSAASAHKGIGQLPFRQPVIGRILPILCSRNSCETSLASLGHYIFVLSALFPQFFDKDSTRLCSDPLRGSVSALMTFSGPPGPLSLILVSSPWCPIFGSSSATFYLPCLAHLLAKAFLAQSHMKLHTFQQPLPPNHSLISGVSQSQSSPSFSGVPALRTLLVTPTNDLRHHGISRDPYT